MAKSAALVAAFIAWIHLTFSVGGALYAWSTYSKRMFDVRLFPDNAAIPTLVGAYMHSVVRADDVIAIGSSFTFGHPTRESATYTSELTRRGIPAVNLGVNGLGMIGIRDWLLCPLQKRDIKVRAVIVEIPLVNEMSWLPKVPKDQRHFGPCPITKDVTLTGFFLRRLMGTSLIRFLFDPYAKYDPPAPPPNAKFEKPPPGYLATLGEFENAAPEFRDNILAIYKSALQISDNVLMFITPVYLEGLSESDRSSVSEQLKVAHEFCREAAGGNCLDTSGLIGSIGNFYNLTHMNGTGAKALAAIVARQFRPVVTVRFTDQ